jgi:hypothetical protein
MKLKSKLFVAGSFALAGIALVPSAASAGKPANQACLGQTDSALASDQPFPGAFGHAVTGFAQDPNGRPGLGDGIQAMLAGAVPDFVVPNTCND